MYVPYFLIYELRDEQKLLFEGKTSVVMASLEIKNELYQSQMDVSGENLLSEIQIS